MKSEKVGCEIALRRARINYFKAKRKIAHNELTGLIHFKSTISPKISTSDYVYKRLLKEIKNLEEKIKWCNNKINFEKASLKQYIEDKDDFYKYIRKKRQGKND